MSFPALKKAAGFQSNYNSGLQQNYTANANSGVMTLQGTITRSLISFGVMLVGAGIGWAVPILMLPGLIVGLVLGLVIAFKQIANPAATLSYSLSQGLVVGGISVFLEGLYPGVVTQAILATFVVFAVIMFFFSRGTFRATPLMNKIFMVAGVSYLLFGLVNLGLMLTGATTGMFGMYSSLGGWGIAIGVLGTLLASYSLIIDFTYVQNAVTNGVASKWEWFAAFSLIGTLVWLYIEILRLLSLFRN